MKDELVIKITEKFNKEEKVHWESPWGIECGDGWYQIIDDTLTLVTGYSGYYYEIEEKRSYNLKPTLIISQIKEKFACIRMYMHFKFEGEDWDLLKEKDITKYNENIWRLRGQLDGVIDYAELLSSKTCEVTGKPGTYQVRNGWFKTLCPEEAEKNDYKPYKQV